MAGHMVIHARMGHQRYIFGIHESPWKFMGFSWFFQPMFVANQRMSWPRNIWRMGLLRYLGGYSKTRLLWSSHFQPPISISFIPIPLMVNIFLDNMNCNSLTRNGRSFWDSYAMLCPKKTSREVVIRWPNHNPAMWNLAWAGTEQTGPSTTGGKNVASRVAKLGSQGSPQEGDTFLTRG